MKDKAQVRSSFKSHARYRVIQLLVAELALVMGLLLVFRSLPSSLFWPLSAAFLISVVFAEPYFTAPRTAIATAMSQVGGYFAADRSTFAGLWNLLLVISALVILAALVAMVRQEGPGELFHWISTRLGRAVVLGSIATLIIMLQIATKDPNKASPMAVVVACIYGIVFLDWRRLILGRRAPVVPAYFVVAAHAPNQLLISSTMRMDVGAKVIVEGIVGSSRAHVAEELASQGGSRYRVVLTSNWRQVIDAAATTCSIREDDGPESPPTGFAIEGSTETTLRVHPAGDLGVGETHRVVDAQGDVLYQVTGLLLEEERWLDSAAIVPRAVMAQVGSVLPNGSISMRPRLPRPYEEIHSGRDVHANLDGRFARIGVLKGTQVPIGIKRDWLAGDGHLAVLGMSGMGKTTVAASLVRRSVEDSCFVVLDQTSEYRTRLDFESVAQVSEVDWGQPGVLVCEPGGEMPAQASSLIRGAMTTAHGEYVQNQLPRRRFVLLEEAHGWLPEWNFTSRTNADLVNESCRYILQARKFNLSFIIVSQRTAVISKSALSQCENYIIFRTLDQTSLDYVEGVVGFDMKRSARDLGRFEAICVGPLFSSDGPVVVSMDPNELGESRVDV